MCVFSRQKNNTTKVFLYKKRTPTQKVKGYPHSLLDKSKNGDVYKRQMITYAIIGTIIAFIFVLSKTEAVSMFSISGSAQADNEEEDDY